jgi:hypothetical protein
MRSPLTCNSAVAYQNPSNTSAASLLDVSARLGGFGKPVLLLWGDADRFFKPSFVVFSVRVKRPRLVAGRVWNLFQDMCGALAVVLVALRLAGVIGWSWWWALAPLLVGGFLFAGVRAARAARLGRCRAPGGLLALRPLVVLESLLLVRQRRARCWWQWRHRGQWRACWDASERFGCLYRGAGPRKSGCPWEEREPTSLPLLLIA